MGMQYDVKNVYAAATGSLVGYRTRVKGMVITSNGGGAGSVVLKDGGSGGSTQFQVVLPATAAFHSVFIPGEGVLFETDVHATLANCSVSVFYG
jgi:hypothetical protein